MKSSRVLMTMMALVATVVFGVGAGAQQAGDPPPAGGETRSPGMPPTLPRGEAAPDEGMTWDQLVAETLKERPVPKSGIIRIDERLCYPHPAVSVKMEIVREEGDTVWVRGLPPEDPDSPLHQLWLRNEDLDMFLQMQHEWVEEHGNPNYYLDFEAPVVPPPFADSLTLVPVISGLPDRGRWQMNFVLDDMNGDGLVDIVLPPMRAGIDRPFVFLGKGDGQFEIWPTLKFAQDVPYDYGGVATGDFDGDGHRDIALAIHFKQQYVLYGDGEGGFTRSEKLPSPDPRISSRAVAVADFDGDGRDDLAFLAEIDYDLQSSTRLRDRPTAWVVLNTTSGWQVLGEGMPTGVIGDKVVAADFDGDGRPDIVTASNAADYRKLLYLNHQDGWSWPRYESVLSNSYHFDVEVAAGDGRPVVVAAFIQFMQIGGENQGRTGLVEYHYVDERLRPVAEPAVVDDDRFNPFIRVATGDLNGNGRRDLVGARQGGGIEIYLRSETGELVRELSPELPSPSARVYDLALVDLDGDGRDDLVVASADSDDTDTLGGVRVWLSRPRS